MDSELISDPLLHSVLASAAQARAQCMSMLDFLHHHRIREATPPDSALLELSKHQKVLNAHLARLRGHHRSAIYDVRATKQQTAEAKSEIDSLHLQLQNFFYEQRHLRGEIAACDGYDHTYQSLSLIPVHEFLALHPDLQDANEHELMIARIDDERAQRQALQEQREALLKRKQTLVAENKKKKDELDNLDKETEKFINASNHVQKIFDAKAQKDAQAA